MGDPNKTAIADVIDTQVNDIDRYEIVYIKDVTLTGGVSNSLQGLVGESVSAWVRIAKDYKSYHQLMEAASSEPVATGSRRWGKHVEGTPYIEHNGKRYVQLIIDLVSDRKFFIKNSPDETNSNHWRAPTADEIEHINSTKRKSAPHQLPLALVAIDECNINSVIRYGY